MLHRRSSSLPRRLLPLCLDRNTPLSARTSRRPPLVLKSWGYGMLERTSFTSFSVAQNTTGFQTAPRQPRHPLLGSGTRRLRNAARVFSRPPPLVRCPVRPPADRSYAAKTWRAKREHVCNELMRSTQLIIITSMGMLPPTSCSARVTASPRASSGNSPGKDKYDNKSQLRHISCHTDKNRYYT